MCCGISLKMVAALVEFSPVKLWKTTASQKMFFFKGRGIHFDVDSAGNTVKIEWNNLSLTGSKVAEDTLPHSILALSIYCKKFNMYLTPDIIGLNSSLHFMRRKWKKDAEAQELGLEGLNSPESVLCLMKGDKVKLGLQNVILSRLNFITAFLLSILINPQNWIHR